MNKFLITGISGFVGKHFIDYLERQAIKSKVLGLDLIEDINLCDYKWVENRFISIDLLNREIMEDLLNSFKPDYVVHLASYSSVANSWENPVLSFQNNTNIFLNLADSIRRLGIKTRILSIGSSEEYGNIINNYTPITEDHNLDPLSPYSVARVSQELLSKIYCNGYGLDIVMTRSFNHIGPGQKDIFVVSSFAKQIAKIKRSGENHGEINVGDVSIVRDFLDVRDVIPAYYGLLMKGKSGEIYNVCSGNGYSIREIIDELSNIAGVEVKTYMNSDLIRPKDNAIIIGNYNKINREIGWQPEISIRKSLVDIYEYWYNRV